MNPASDAPIVSVVIPLYNGKAVIEGALDSLIAQTDARWEAIVVDDASTDDGAATVAAYGAAYEDREISVIRLRENGGPSRARNTGVAAARGTFICFLDADDSLLPDALGTLLDAADDPELDVVGGAHVAVAVDGSETVRADRAIGRMSGIDAVNALLQDRIWNFNHGKLYRRTLLGTVTHREEVRRYEDLVFNASAYSYSRAVRLVDAPVYRYRISAGSATWSQRLTADYVTDTERLVREGLNPAVEAQVTRRSWRMMRAALAVVVYSGALVSDADPEQLAELRGVMRRSVRLRDLPDVFACAPAIAVSAVAARLTPGLYARLYRAHVRRSYGLDR